MSGYKSIHLHNQKNILQLNIWQYDKIKQLLLLDEKQQALNGLSIVSDGKLYISIWRCRFAPRNVTHSHCPIGPQYTTHMYRSVRRSSVGWLVGRSGGLLVGLPKRAGGFTSMLLSKPLFHQNISSPLSDYLSSSKYSSSNIPFSDCLSSFNYSSYSSAHFPSNRTYILLEIKIQSPGSFEGDHSRNQSLSISPFLYI